VRQSMNAVKTQAEGIQASSSHWMIAASETEVTRHRECAE
jgi:hypothetical protein